LPLERLQLNEQAKSTSTALAQLSCSNSAGGLILAGSYVPKTTAQLKLLRERRGDKLLVIELDVGKLITSEAEANKIVEKTVNDATQRIKSGQDVLIMTSRNLIVGSDAISSLKIGGVVAASLVKVLQGIKVRPRYVIAKVSGPGPCVVLSRVCPNTH